MNRSGIPLQIMPICVLNNEQYLSQFTIVVNNNNYLKIIINLLFLLLQMLNETLKIY